MESKIIMIILAILVLALLFIFIAKIIIPAKGSLIDIFYKLVWR